MQLLMDCHTHTQFSPDGSGTVAALCERACSLHLPVLAITDHVEMNRFFSQAYYAEVPRNEWEFYHHAQILEDSLAEITEQKGQYVGLRLLAGMEMGQPNVNFALSQTVAQDKRLDFVIASLHELLGEEDFFNLDYSNRSVSLLLSAYFSQLLDICQNADFDVLGHFTYPLRYIEGEAGIPVDLAPYRGAIEDCFRTLIQRGKGIELNTSGYRQKYAKPFPTLALLRCYREMGGEILTLGSDAHCAEDLGKGIAQGITLAKEAGFREACYFIKRKPVFVPLDTGFSETIEF